MRYHYTAGTLNEFYDINLLTQAQPGKLVGGSLAIPNVGGAPPIIRMFLRRPRYSKGNAYNWATNPATNRFFTWFDKEVSTVQAVAGIFDHFEEPHF